MQSVIGMDSASSAADRHSQKPNSAITTTSAMASYRLWVNRPTDSSTCRGWSEVRARMRSSGRLARASASARSTLAPKSAICMPERIETASVTARVRCHVPALSRDVYLLRKRGGFS